MDSKSPTNNDAENDADPPDLISTNYFSPNYNLVYSSEPSRTTSALEARVIEIQISFSHEDATGDNLSDFVLGLDLSRTTERTFDFHLVLSDTNTTGQVAEEKDYSQSEYSDAQQTRVGSRVLINV